MSKPHPRAFRAILIFFLVLALGAVFTSSAQSTDLTQFAKTLDGQISVHLPAGWQSRDAANPYFTSILAFGDSATSLQAVVDSLAATQTTTQPGMNGVIGIVQPTLVTGLPAELAINTLINSLISSAQQTGGRVVQQESTMIANQYPGTIVIISNTGQDAAGIVGVFQAGADIVEFSIGASPARNFDSNQELFFNMMDSIRVPAEEGVPDIQPAQPTAVPPVGPIGEGGVVAAPSGAFSLRLPQGYVSGTVTIENFADSFAFGNSASAQQDAITTFVNGVNVTDFAGIGGVIGEINPQLLAGQDIANLVAPLMQSMVAAVQLGTVQVVVQPQAHIFGNQYDGQLAELNQGYVGVLYSGQQLLVVIIRTDNMAANRVQMDAILDSIRIPAETAPVTLPTQVAPAPTTVPPAESQTFRSSDLRTSLVIPGDWVVLDHIEEANILAFGDSEAAAQYRLHSAQPSLAPETPISGNGGLIILYPMSQFGIDPASPDLNPLMTRALGNLAGYTVEQAAAPLEDIPNALYAVIAGTEHGYLALIPFGDQIAYVTATGTAETFNPNNGLLFDILMSVRVPAELEPTPAPTSAGLGGLGGLGEVEVTPEATAAGLGGL